MPTSYKDGVNAIDRLLREAEQVVRGIPEHELERTEWPGHPLLRSYEIPGYLRRVRDWLERVKDERDRKPPMQFTRIQPAPRDE